MKPIIFRAHEVRQLQTAGEVLVVRLIKPQPVPFGSVSASPTQMAAMPWMPVGGVHIDLWCSTLGTPSERRWVRETWRVCGGCEYEYQQDRSQVMYRATHKEDGFPFSWESYKWRSSAVMPRWASRYVVEIAEVQARQVQAITEAEAIAAGVQLGGPIGHIPSYLAGPYAYHFAQLWDYMNGPDSWSANPWAWFAKVRRVEV